jgi:pimeloyl-ACP methyl ester carboxylesterase
VFLDVLDALGFEDCVLAEESTGGAIAQYAAERHPDLDRRFTAAG